jgi:hypothetical protein
VYKTFIFQCQSCEHRFESLVDAGPEGLREEVKCPECAGPVNIVPMAARKFEVIAVLKKNKAGYAHKFANRPREKISVSVPGKP